MLKLGELRASALTLIKTTMKMNPLRIFPSSLVLITTLFAGSLSADEYRTLHNSHGNPLEAQVTAYDPTKGVSIQTRSGQKYENVGIDRFSPEDQKYFKEWQAKHIAEKDDAQLMHDSKITMFVKSSRDDDLNDKGDPDNREVEYDPAITFDNKDKDLSYQNVEGTLVFIGQSVLDKKEYHILYRQDFTVNLPSGERTRWVGKSFKNVYDDYARNGSAFGAEYEGYLLVLNDKLGHPAIIKASKSHWKGCIRSILAANSRQGYSRDFSESFKKTVY
tara:strand:+ start:71 stop:898 length:828 start_codon:yes stop_codon:yes gene_type:complete